MARVFVPTLFRTLCGGQQDLNVPASTLEELLRGIDALCPGFYERVVKNGRVRGELAVAIDSEAATYPLHEPLRADAHVTIIPAIGGG